MKTSIVAAVAALSIFGIASSASAMCGPNLNINLSQNTNSTINDVTGNTDSVGVAEYGDTFNFGSNSNLTNGQTKGLTASIGLTFNLDGGRGCEEVDLRIAQQKDNIARAARQEEMQRRQQAAGLINNLLAGIAYCETADLNIPANAQFCTDYLSK